MPACSGSLTAAMTSASRTKGHRPDPDHEPVAHPGFLEPLPFSSPEHASELFTAPAIADDERDLEPSSDVAELACTPAHTREIIEALLATLARSDADIYTVARIIAPLAPADEYDYRHRAFWQRLNYFCRLYLRSSRWLKAVENATPVTEFSVPGSPALARHTDAMEALWSGFRTFCALTAVGAWAITTQWDAGSAALTLAAISCVLYSVAASPLTP